MNVLSLFDGHGTGRLALDLAGIPDVKYYASEIDKPAIRVAYRNYPDINHVGSILDLNGDSLPPIDLVIGGSPCQSFSRSGNGEGFDGKSGLFWEYVRLIKEVNPKNFLLENVVMRKDWEDIISEALGVSPVLIDSSLVSAQKRQRLYWTNIEGIEQPEDRGITLLDIVEGGRDIIEDHPLVLAQGDGEYMIRNATKKGYLIAQEGDSVNLEVPNSKTRRGRVGRGKTNTLNTACNYAMIYKGNLVRLNINDFERLQTLPVNYTSGESDNQRRKMIGNGWTAEVIAHFFRGIK